MERLDQFDYEALGLRSSWYVESTLTMLTSFEMETKGYFSRDGSNDIYLKILYKYRLYMYEIMYSGDLPYKTPTECWEQHLAEYGEPAKHIVASDTLFDKDQFLKCIENDKNANIDIVRLKRFLSGEEVPVISDITSELKQSIDDLIPPICIASDQIDINTSLDVTVATENKYIFRNMNHFWIAAYNGKETHVKDRLGMKYIAELIKHKHKSLTWIDLFNAVKGTSPEQIEPGTAAEDISYGFNLSQGKAMRVYAGKDKKLLQNQINELKEDLSEAMACDNHNEAEDLEDQIDKLEKYVLDTYRQDGTLKESSSSNDKMINGIKAAIKRALEDIEVALPDLDKHLHDTIVVHWQRSNPSYSPAIDIEWEM